MPTADELLHDLDDSQRQAVTSPARPLAIVAPAGSGKTRVLTRRIAWRVATEDAEAPHVLALTFTRKAATELRTRLAGLGLRGGVAAGTFHSIAYAQLRARWTEQGRPAPILVTRKTQLLEEALDEAVESGERTDRRLKPSGLAGEIEWAKARLLGPDAYPQGAAEARRRPPVPAELVARAYTAYEQVKQRRNTIDFDDLLKLCADALLTDVSFAAAQRWRFRHLFVDEFQDVNALQLRLLDAWRGNHYDLCVVGDPQQAIYGWNGSDPALLAGFRSRYPPAEVIVLERNYRSTPQVLTTAEHVLRQARLDPAAARTTQADGPPPRIVRHPTDTDEAVAVARNVRDRRAPRTAWSAQAVLVRTHSQIGPITEALRAARIPHRVRGSTALLDDPQLREALGMLRRDTRALSASLPDLDAMVAEAATASTDDSGGGGQPPSALEILLQLARDHHQVDPQATGAGFAAWAVATLQAEGVDGTGDAVTVATFHAAKGLEWPVVHLAGLEDGFTPVSHARSSAARAEEARVLYVAMTRAVSELWCTWAARRRFNGRTVDRRICPWLRDLADVAELANRGRDRMPPPRPGSPEADWREQLARQRERLAAARSEPTPALAAAQAWRQEVARRARVEPHTVVDDAVLEAVAEAMPSSQAELTAVPGMSPLLSARLGDDLLAALATVDQQDTGTQPGS